MQEAKKAGEIKPFKASMFLAQKYPSRCTADHPEAWRGGSAKEPGQEILVHQTRLHSCSFSKSTFSSEAIFDEKTCSQFELSPHATVQKHMDSQCPASLYLSCLPVLFSQFAEFKIMTKCTQVLYCLFCVCLFTVSFTDTFNPMFFLNKFYKLGILVMFL